MTNKLLNFYRNLENKMLGLDLSSKCNLKCIYCPFQSNPANDRHKDFMDFTLFKRIINEQIKLRIKYKVIFLSISGESLLHPKIKEIFKILFESNKNGRLFAKLSLNTNVTYLNPQLIDYINSLLLNSPGVIHYTLSINAASHSTFKKIKGKNFFDETIFNAKHLLLEKKRLNIGFKQNIYLQYLIHETSFNEAKKFMDYWGDFMVQHNIKYSVDYEFPFKEGFDNIIVFKRIYSENQKKYDNLHRKAIKELGLLSEDNEDLKKHVPMFHKVKRRPCPSLWISPVVRVDGTLSPCLQDTADTEELGNLNNNSFEELWFSEKANNLRRIHLMGQFDKIGICKNCNYFSGPKLSDDTIHRYQEFLNIKL